MTATPQLRADLPEAAVIALHQGNKIEAIKIYRQAHGVGLRESKNAIDTYLQAHPPLLRKLQDRDANARRGCLVWLLVVAAIGTAGYFLVTDA